MTNLILFRRIYIFTALIFLISLSVVAWAQNRSTKSVQMDPDWEKIRDAQVLMIKKKEAELDRIKEALLTRAQPQSQIQMGFPEIEAEMRKREAEWLQKSDRYDNDIMLLKVKIEEQRTEIKSLRGQLTEGLKKQLAQEKKESSVPEVFTKTSVPGVLPSDLKSQEERIFLREKQLSEKQAEFDLKVRQMQSSQDMLLQLQKERVDFEKQRANWDAAQIQHDQKNEADRLQFETNLKALENQKKELQKEREELELTQKKLQIKLKDFEKTNQKSQAIQAQESQIKSRSEEVEKKEKQLLAVRADLEAREELNRKKQDEIAAEQQVWVKKKNEMIEMDSNRVADLELRLKKVQEAKQLADFSQADSEMKFQRLKSQNETEKNSAVQQKLKWTKQEGKWLQTQTELKSQLTELQKQLAQEQVDFSKKEMNWNGQLNGLTKKLAQAESSWKLADLRVQEISGQALRQRSNGKEEWVSKIAVLQKQNGDLNVLNAQLEKEKNGLNATAAQLEDKIKALQNKQELPQGRNPNSNQSFSEVEMVEVKRRLERSEFENLEWRQGKQQLEKNWAEFVSRETQYQMEIQDLSKRNQEFQNLLKTKQSVGVNQHQTDGDWRISMDQRLARERQDLEQVRTQLARQQREFEKYIRSEKVKLERQRRQPVRA